MHKGPKICIQRLIWKSFAHHKQLWQVGNVANVIYKKNWIVQQFLKTGQKVASIITNYFQQCQSVENYTTK